MFCPSCGTETNDPTKFCTKCGFNLGRIKKAMTKEEDSSQHWQGGSFWEKIALEEHKEKRKKNPEEKRLNEIKGGVITSCVGLALMIFLGILFNAIANSVGDPEVNPILRAIPFAGFIPFLIGIGIIFNGMFIGKRIVEVRRRQDKIEESPSFRVVPETSPVHRLGEASQNPTPDYSIAEPTTTKLREPAPMQTSKESK